MIGILATMFTLSIGVTGGDRQLETEVDRLVAVMTLAREEAVVQGREIGLRFYRDTYEFSTFYEDFVEYHDEENPDQSEWALLDDSTLLGARTLPDGLLFEMEIEGREIVLKAAEEKDERDEPPEATTEDAADKDPKKNQDLYAPQVYVFSSGDISPFTILIRREFVNTGTTIAFDIDGSFEIDEGER